MENPFNRLQIKSRQKLYLILALVSLTLLFYSIWAIKWVVVDINDFLGLTSHLTAAYWVGLGLITLCSVLVYLDDELKNDWIFIFILIVVGLFLFGLGVFAEENPRAWSSYYPTGEVKNVMETYHIDTISRYPLISYRFWPAFHFISASILYVTGIGLSNLVKYMPLFWVICYIFMILFIGKKLKMHTNQAFALSFLSLASFWQIYYYYSPQSYAYIASLIIFAFLVIFNNYLKTKLLILLTFSMLMITHFFYGVIMLIASSIHLLRKKQIGFAILIMLIFIAWYIYLAPVAFEGGVLRFINTASNLEPSLSSQLEKFTPSTSMKKQVDTFRFLYLLINVTCLLLCGLIYKCTRIEKEKKDIIKTCFYWIVIFASLGLVSYGVESFERIYLFTIVPTLCIITLSFSSMKKIVIILMCVFIAIHIPAHYGSDTFLMTYSSELEGSEFFASNVEMCSLKSPPEKNYIYFGGGDRYISYYNPSFVTITCLSETFIELQKNGHFLNKTLHIIEGKHEINLRTYYARFPGPINNWLKIDKSNVDLVLIYDNGGLKIYNLTL